MKLFLNRAERFRYLGFDDRLMVVILIPLVAVIAAVIIHPSLPDAPDGGNMVLSCYLISLLYTSVYWVVIRSIIIYLRYRIPRQDRLMRRLSLLFFSSLAVVLFFNVLIDRLLVWFFPSLEASADDLPSFTVSLVVSVLLCVLVSSIYEFIYFLFKYRQSLIEQERLARANMQAQLSALKQQVNPHFLFNSLNTLANIIPEDQGLATRFVQRLAAVYRRLLEYRHQDTISLGDELTALRDYAFLLQTRFEDKLTVRVATEGGEEDLPDYLLHRRVVPLCLQLLLENAVKHNVVSKEYPLSVRIIVSEDRVTVTNNRRPRLHPEDSTGLGQQNIRRRYHLVSEEKVRIDATATAYSVSIPLLSTSKIATNYATA